ncbi:PaaI family thioesterase [Fuchsiella alkaliacetigena]|uniref:PaaI family thioesterase n=1 Tax=Fuchsiella alkaliacetigena TaxID=957042 RepID=UPI00200A76EA|nr:PaaI family thioesterase [Fuchsiella alkaliacetigena]MCK8823986.1 PaaI family thioesterase [Fuchsiella alkaliacetigena]
MVLEGDDMCFACGAKNPIGLQLDFETEEEVVKAEFIPQEVHQGFDGIMHGGLTSTLLDEVMANTLYLKEVKAVTAKLELKFRQPVPIGEKLIVKGWIEKEKRKTVYTAAELLNTAGEKYAEAEAVFMKQVD